VDASVPLALGTLVSDDDSPPPGVTVIPLR